MEAGVAEAASGALLSPFCLEAAGGAGEAAGAEAGAGFGAEEEETAESSFSTGTGAEVVAAAVVEAVGRSEAVNGAEAIEVMGGRVVSEGAGAVLADPAFAA